MRSTFASSLQGDVLDQTMHHLVDRQKAAVFAWTGLVDGRVGRHRRPVNVESLFDDWLVVWRRIDPTASGTFAQHIDELEGR
jgi:hypothetical protein